MTTPQYPCQSLWGSREGGTDATTTSRPTRPPFAVSAPAAVSAPTEAFAPGYAAPATDDESPHVVWKFGGTSVADPGKLRAVATRLIAARRAGHRVVAVLSAMGDSTDRLHRLAYELSSHPQLRELDALLSTGEAVSCALASMAVHELGGRAVSLTGPQAGIRTDDRHGNARLKEIRPRKITEALDSGAIVLITGFQGVSSTGDVTTLGRGGSDASAVAIAAALGLSQCEVFTDVAGVYTADPRVVPNARRLAVLTHDEMLQLAEAGATVLQARAVELAQAHGIDIHVRSSFTTEPGTWIRKEGTMFEDTEVAGIAHRHDERLYSVHDVSPATVSSALARRGAAVGAMVHLGGEVRFTAPGVERAEITSALDSIGARVGVHDDLGSVSVISTGIGRQPDVTARALAALEHAGISLKLITSTPNRVSCHISSAMVDRAVRLLHDVFGLELATDSVGAGAPLPRDAA